MKEAYIIFCNDNPETVVIEDEKYANELKEEMAHKDYIKQKKLGALGSRILGSEKEYRQYCYWHIHEVEVREK